MHFCRRRQQLSPLRLSKRILEGAETTMYKYFRHQVLKISGTKRLFSLVGKGMTSMSIKKLMANSNSKRHTNF